MKKIISVFLIISFMGMSCASYKRGKGLNLKPGQKPGVDLIIQKKDGTRVRGELIAVKENSLVLLSSEGADITVNIRDISVIIGKKSRVGSGFLYGFIFGGSSLGTLAGLGMHDMRGHVASAVLGGVVIGGLLFGGLYALICSIAPSAQIIRIEGKSEIEIKEVLEDLRPKARVPDYN